MDCRSARDALIDQQVAGAGPVSEDVVGHLQSCAACRAEAGSLKGLWSDLGRLAAPAPDPARIAVVEAALAHAVRSAAEPAAVPAPGTRRGVLAGVAAAALAAGLILGLAFGRLATTPAPAVAPVAQTATRYLLLLHGPSEATPPDAAQVRARVAEYGDWARSLRAEGRLMAAEKLGDEPAAWLPDAAANPPADDVVTGFFLITAQDEADALRVARASPHLRHGGRIEVRRIDET